MIRNRKHSTCVGCFAHCVSFPSSLHCDGNAFCTLGYPVKSASINHERPYDHEAIPLDKCPRPTSHKKFCEATTPMALVKSEKETYIM